MTLDTFTLLPSLENYSKLKVPREYEKKEASNKKIAHIWSKVRDVTEKESPNAIHLMLAERREHKRRAEK